MTSLLSLPHPVASIKRDAASNASGSSLMRDMACVFFNAGDGLAGADTLPRPPGSESVQLIAQEPQLAEVQAERHNEIVFYDKGLRVGLPVAVLEAKVDHGFG